MVCIKETVVQLYTLFIYYYTTPQILNQGQSDVNETGLQIRWPSTDSKGNPLLVMDGQPQIDGEGKCDIITITPDNAEVFWNLYCLLLLNAFFIFSIFCNIFRVSVKHFFFKVKGRVSHGVSSKWCNRKNVGKIRFDDIFHWWNRRTYLLHFVSYLTFNIPTTQSWMTNSWADSWPLTPLKRYQHLAFLSK